MTLSPRPQSIDWKMQWIIAKGETQDWNIKFLQLERQLGQLKATQQSVRQFLENHGLESIEDVEEQLLQYETYIKEFTECNNDLQAQHAQVLANYETVNAEIQKYEEQLLNADDQSRLHKEETTHLESLISSMQIAREQELQTHEAQMSEMAARIEEYTEATKHIQEEKSELEAGIKDLRQSYDQKLKEADNQLETKKAKLDQTQKLLERSQQEHQLLQSACDSLRSLSRQAKAQIDTKESELLRLHSRLEEALLANEASSKREAALRDTIHELEATEDRQHEFFAQLNQASVQIESLEQQVQEFQQQERDLLAEITTLESNKLELEQSFSGLASENKQLYYDLKNTKASSTTLMGRIAALEARNNQLQTEVTSQCQYLEVQKQQWSAASENNTMATRKFEELELLYQQEREISQKCQEQLNEIEGLVNEKMLIITDLKGEIQGQKSIIEDQKLRIETNENAKSIEKDHVRQNEELRRNLYSLKTEKEQSEERLSLESKLRRRLQEQLLDLKGTIRVFCRIRPVIAAEMFREGSIVLDTSNHTVEINQATNGYGGAIRKSRFSFDHVFDHSSTNNQIFDEIDLLTQSIFNGFSCCIFAYGQTGSGKSYTMLSEDGVVRLTNKNIFDLIKIMDHDTEVKIFASFFEIYNEKVIDLASTGGQSPPVPVHSMKRMSF